MTYIKVQWLHEFEQEPVWLYSELDAERNELRKVEIFRDGEIGYASRDESCGDSMLSECPIPELGEIALDPQFIPKLIERAEFEQMWELRNFRLPESWK